MLAMWQFFQKSTISEIEQKAFLDHVIEMCKWKILEMEDVVRRDELSDTFSKYDGQERVQALFNEMSVSFKKDVGKMVAKEIDLANRVIIKQGFNSVQPMQLESAQWAAYKAALEFKHEHKFFPGPIVHGYLRNVVFHLKAFDDIGWTMEYELMEGVEAVEKKVSRTLKGPE